MAGSPIDKVCEVFSRKGQAKKRPLRNVSIEASIVASIENQSGHSL
jgi:hypothetical protein